MIRSFADTSPRFATKLGTSANPPRSVAQRLGLKASRHIYSYSGGNMPQYLLNQFAESIARGEMRAALLCGGEALRTQHGLERTRRRRRVERGPGRHARADRRSAPRLERSRRRCTACARRSSCTRCSRTRSAARAAVRLDAHQQAIGTLMARFAAVAAANPLATRREGYSAEQLVTVNDDNRWIGFPYPRLMNANAFIDQSAAVVMTSVATARELGIPRDKWVFLHGCADAHDHWYVSERVDLHSSPAIRAASRQALAMAGKTLDDIDVFDLYSCFASAVQIGCQEIGLAEDDPRGLTDHRRAAVLRRARQQLRDAFDQRDAAPAARAARRLRPGHGQRQLRHQTFLRRVLDRRRRPARGGARRRRCCRRSWTRCRRRRSPRRHRARRPSRPTP